MERARVKLREFWEVPDVKLIRCRMNMKKESVSKNRVSTVRSREQ